ncbi:lysozyme inhibitor LprI family protein [Sphingomonas endolithica]|uniref:lysozyme inhibitor LprI family protein n=1 Tax=Sphingomonas endolithica TaxID=2972485 RepID=UPI0021B031AC|nr:lysozyme inhibitor LprI family protein [Sphingomonas sp. ZFBP2030]
MLLIALFLAAAAPVQTQADMNRSAGASYVQADAAMTAQWQRTYAHMKSLDAQDGSRGGGFGYAAALLASQRAWLKFRDTQCVIQGGEFAGGSAQSMLVAQCRSQLTRARTQQLKTLIWNH